MEIKKVHAKYTEEFKARIMDFGADLVGIANVDPLKELTLIPLICSNLS